MLLPVTELKEGGEATSHPPFLLLARSVESTMASQT
jgi:hypothetical protein